ncbi:MAG: PQQ-dependent sugar dehydrogenase [Blastocatellia bacterium]|nr:PQQ-dependent sugar dehydrogenase [Blastocatellia bacterium]
MRRVMLMMALLLLGAFLASRLRGMEPAALAQATTTAPPIQLVPVVNGLSSPILVTNAKDGSNRLFIVERSGRIKILPQGASAVLGTPFIDLSGKIVTGSGGDERGLLGLAFHPQFNANRRFFVNYTRRPDGATIVAEYKASAANPNVADTEERVILTVPQPYANHNGGMIEFGPDGFLYIGMGDGGSGDDPENRAQNLDSLLGKMLRIDVNSTSGSLQYAIPPSNPYVNQTGADEIYAVGLRNPWRWSFDRGTGELYAGDVGQGQVEEIDIITLGGNYGWRVLEGTRCTNLGPASCSNAAFIPPVVQYNQTQGRCSITGGYVYRGTRNMVTPGTYVYGDYCTGEIFTWRKGQAISAVNLMIDTNISLVSFGEDEAGELYVVGLSGTVHRLVGSAPPAPVSAASFRGAPFAPESILAVFGTGFSNATQSAGTSLPTTLAGTTVSIRDAAGTTRSAPLFFVSPTQINFQVPAGTATGDATVTINHVSTTAVGNYVTTASQVVNVASVAPGLFSASATGRGLAAAVALRVTASGAQTFEPVIRFDTATNQFVAVPIDLGPETDQVFLVPYGTGFRNRSSLNAVTATVGGTSVQVTFAGAQGQLVGLDQANLRLPRTLLGRGEVDVVMTVDGQTANTVRVSIK